MASLHMDKLRHSDLPKVTQQVGGKAHYRTLESWLPASAAHTFPEEDISKLTNTMYLQIQTSHYGKQSILEGACDLNRGLVPDHLNSTLCSVNDLLYDLK